MKSPDNWNWDKQHEKVVKGIKSAEDEDRFGGYAGIWVAWEDIPLGLDWAAMLSETYA